MPDHSSLSLSTHPTLGLGCFASNWTALCNWDRRDSQTNPLRCHETRAQTDFLFVRDQARAKMLLASLVRIVPEMEAEVERYGLPALTSQINWLNNLRGRLTQIVNSKDEPRMIGKVEKLSDTFSHEVNRDQYYVFVKRSISNRQGAQKKPRGLQDLRKCVQKRFKTPTAPPLAMVRELLEQVKKEREGAEYKEAERKIRNEVAKKLKAQTQREVEILQRRVDKLEKEKAAAVRKQNTPAPNAETRAVTNSEVEVPECPQVVEEGVQTAIEAIQALPEPGTDNIPPQNFVLGLPQMGPISLSAGAVIRRTQTAIEILQPGAQEPISFPVSKDVTIPLNFHTADGRRVSQPWSLVPGCTVRRMEDGIVLYEWD